MVIGPPVPSAGLCGSTRTMLHPSCCWLGAAGADVPRAAFTAAGPAVRGAWQVAALVCPLPMGGASGGSTSVEGDVLLVSPSRVPPQPAPLLHWGPPGLSLLTLVSSGPLAPSTIPSPPSVRGSRPGPTGLSSGGSESQCVTLLPSQEVPGVPSSVPGPAASHGLRVLA